jgi:hypothetical protein
MADGTSAVSLMLLQMGFSYKKSGPGQRTGAARRGRKAQLLVRVSSSLDPQKVVFIAETGCATNMIRLRGRSLRGKRSLENLNLHRWAQNHRPDRTIGP